MTIKTITSKDAQNSFWRFLDSVQREPVLVTRRSRPVGVMVSIADITNLYNYFDFMDNDVTDRKKSDLADVKTEVSEEVTKWYIKNLKKELQSIITSSIKEKSKRYNNLCDFIGSWSEKSRFTSVEEVDDFISSNREIWKV